MYLTAQNIISACIIGLVVARVVYMDSCTVTRHNLSCDDNPVSPSSPHRTMVAYRRGCRVVESKGIFPQAEVVRGHDWSWGQQDGE